MSHKPPKPRKRSIRACGKVSRKQSFALSKMGREGSPNSHAAILANTLQENHVNTYLAARTGNKPYQAVILSLQLIRSKDLDVHVMGRTMNDTQVSDE